MPLFNFATYADTREEWAIRADSLEHIRALIGDDPNGDWLNDAFLIEACAVETRDEFVMDDDDAAPAIEEITPDHWSWEAAHEDYRQHSVMQNLAAISGDFHSHRLYGAFYDMFGEMIEGFTGCYDLCIAMAKTLTQWEVGNGLGLAYENAGVPWIEVVECFVEAILETATESGEIPDPAKILPALQVLAPRQGG